MYFAYHAGGQGSIPCAGVCFLALVFYLFLITTFFLRKILYLRTVIKIIIKIWHYSLKLFYFTKWRNRVAERLALPTSDHGIAGSNPAGGEILPEPKRRFIAQSRSCSPFHRLEMTEILLKGRKTLSHPSIHFAKCEACFLLKCFCDFYLLYIQCP